MGLFYYSWALDQSRADVKWREQPTHVTSFEAADVLHRSLSLKRSKSFSVFLYERHKMKALLSRNSEFKDLSRYF